MKTPGFIFVVLCICFIQADCYRATVKDEVYVVNPHLILHGLPDSLKKPFRPEVPVLCYHQIGSEINKEKSYAGSITVSANAFEQQMKILYDSGYRTILPDQLICIFDRKNCFHF
jgi:hypothetical protein